MIRIALWVFFGLAACSLQGQSSLTYNQVIDTVVTFNYTGNSQIIGALNVPQGKVWKIEGAELYSISGGLPRPLAYGSNFFDCQVFLGGQLIVRRTAEGGWNGQVSYPVKLPIWLSSGNKDMFFFGNVNQTFSHAVSLSIIEFNE